MTPSHRRTGQAALALVALLAFGISIAGATGAGTADTAAVENVLVRFSAALCAGDAATLRHLMAPDFALLEEGRAYDGDGTIASVIAVLSTGALNRVSSQFHTRVRGNVAWSHYRVTGTFRGSGEPLSLDLLESAVLERTRGGWRVVLMTTMPQGAGSESSR